LIAPIVGFDVGHRQPIAGFGELVFRDIEGKMINALNWSLYERQLRFACLNDQMLIVVIGYGQIKHMLVKVALCREIGCRKGQHLNIHT